MLLAAAPALAQDAGELRELIGQMGGRAALLSLYVVPRADGSSRLTGECLILATLQQRFLEGERSRELGVTFRSARETLAPTLDWLKQTGRIA